MSAARNSYGQSVLLVESDHAIRRAAAHALMEGGYRVDVADSLNGMMLALERGTPDLLMTEAHLPDGSVPERLAEITKRIPSLAVVLMSARGNADAAARKHNARHLHKPFGTDDVLDAARSALGGAGQRSLEESAHYHIMRFFDDGDRADDARMAGIHARIMGEVEKPLIEISLRRTGGNQLRAAKLLGLNRNTLRKKIRQFGINAGALAASRSQRNRRRQG